MTVVDGIHKVCIHVGSKLIEKILLNISSDGLSRVIGEIPTCHGEVVLGENTDFRSVESILE